MTLEAGTRLSGRYTIERLLGAGGMGEVYLAFDAELRRPVALKFLPAEVAADQKRLDRFEREALAASALNHPNILTVHDIGKTEDGRRFFATEYVRGVTLREHMKARRLRLGEVLDIAAQAASALAAAHAEGIVHRDVKPENLMLRADGYVKVLDFGLAKLTGRPGASVDTEAATRALVQTDPGAVMGTVAYMSPEQAQGLEVDHRTDLWSLGVVLYEMLTGRPPFAGKSTSHTIVSILDDEPPPLAARAPDAPEALQEIVSDALTKDREARFQTAKQFHAKLARLKRRLDASATFDASAVPSAPTAGGDASGGASASPSGATAGGAQTGATQSGAHATRLAAARTAEGAAAETASSAEFVAAKIRAHRKGFAAALAVAFVLVAAGVVKLVGAGYLAGRFFGGGGSTPSPPVFQNVAVSRVTTSGTAKEANISPDGKYVVYLEEASDGNRSLWVRQTATGNALSIVPPTKGNILKSLTFSPDGNFVYYVFTDRVAPETLYRVPSIGGSPPKKVVADCQSPAAVSPDGKRLAFVRREGRAKSALMTANEDGTGERTIATLEGRSWFEDYGPSWSPDGRTIAVMTGSFADEGDEFRLVGFDAESGAARELSPKRWLGAGRVVWMPDGAALLVVASENIEGERPQVWRVSHPSGEASRVTNDVQGRNRESLGLTADGRTLVTVTEQNLSRVETVPAGGDASRLARLTAAEANHEGFHGLAWTPQGRVVFSSFEGGQSDIRIMDADGGGRQRLTSDGFWDGDPAVSPDGRYVVFVSNRPKGGNAHRLWRMDVDGGNPVQLTAGNVHAPHVSPDGRWVVYALWSASEGTSSLWRVPVEGGEPVRLTDYPAGKASYSPDGQWIVCLARDPAEPGKWRYSVIPAAGGRPVRQFDLTGFIYQYVRWTPDGRHLSHIGSPPDPSNIWLQPAEGGEARKLTDFKSDYIFRHAWSPDGRTLALVRGRDTSDVVLLKDER